MILTIFLFIHIYIADEAAALEIKSDKHVADVRSERGLLYTGMWYHVH